MEEEPIPGSPVSHEEETLKHTYIWQEYGSIGSDCQSCSWSAEERKKWIFPSPRSCLRIWSRETGSAVPSHVSLLISILRLNLVLTYGIPPDFRDHVHLFILNRHTPSGQSRVDRVTQMRTDGVHCRESAGTGPVNLKVVPNDCCLGRSPWTNQYAPLSPTPTRLLVV